MIIVKKFKHISLFFKKKISIYKILKTKKKIIIIIIIIIIILLKYNLLKDPETASILDVVFFKITIENRELSNYNKVKLKGKTHNYCAEECTLDNISGK